MKRQAGTLLLLAALGGCNYMGARNAGYGQGYAQAPPPGMTPTWQVGQSPQPNQHPQPNAVTDARICPAGHCPPMVNAICQVPAPPMPLGKGAAVNPGLPAAPLEPLVPPMPAPVNNPMITDHPAEPTFGTAEIRPAMPPPEPSTIKTGLTTPAAEAEAIASANSQINRLPSGPPDPGVLTLNPGNVRMVNSRRVSLNYELKDVGPSGVSSVELWLTLDGGKSWQKYNSPPQARPPFVAEVNDEGLYGFTLVARSGLGIGKKPPQPGDAPQAWVEMDLTKPEVKLESIEAGINADPPHLQIAWKASDKNLGPRPITLSYAERPTGPWMLIASNVENTGRFVWPVPPGLPSSLLVRVEATDLVGNVGEATTPNPVLVDLSQPSVSILGIEGAGK